MATIKAGTYRFNDVLTKSTNYTVEGAILFNSSVNGETVTCNGIYERSLDDWLTLAYSVYITELGDYMEAKVYNDGWYTDDFGDGIKTITIPTDSEVSDEFYAWFTANAAEVVEDTEETPVATITYDGSVIASLNEGQTATLKCKGDNMKMLSDIVVRVAGNSGGGGSVECNRQHVIEVDKLPIGNIDKNAVYYCDGKYYKWANEFVDLFIRGGGEVLSFAQVIGVDPSMITYHIAPTKPKGNIEVSSESGFHCYYIEDENNVFFYGDFEGTGNNVWFGIEVIFRGIQFNGVIANAGEITDEGAYALVEKGFRTYTHVSGTLKITQVGTYDVTDKASVVVNTPNEAIVGVWKFNVSEDGYIPLNTNGEGRYYSDSYDVNFTCVYNGEAKICNKIEVGGDNTGGGEFISFYDINGNAISAANGIEGAVLWNSDVSPIIIFGTDPQVIYEKFKSILSTVATPRYNIVQT